MRTKRGAYLVEMSLVFPLLVLLTMILFSTAFHYHEAALQQAEAISAQREEEMRNGPMGRGEAEFIRKTDSLVRILMKEEKGDESKK